MKTSAEVRKAVINELKQNPFLCSSGINVDVIVDTIFLSGNVDSYHKKFEAGRLIRSLEPDKKVHLDICVELPQEIKKSDAEIKNAILNGLQLYTSIPKDKISVSVYDRIVVLTGEADCEEQKADATEAIINVPGILNLWNFIKVNTVPAKQDVKNSNKPEPDKNTATKLRMEELVAV